MEEKIPKKRRAKSRIYVKDNDLQIQVPIIKDASLSHRALRCRIPFSLMHTHVEPISRVKFPEEELTLAMEEATDSYDSMMQIQEQLNQAYKEFIKINHLNK